MVNCLFSEFVVLPGTCRVGAYSSAEMSDAFAGSLAARVNLATFVRDLRDGEWRKAAARAAGGPDRRWRKLLEHWVKSQRVLSAPPQGALSCDDDAGWLREAQASHAERPISGVIGPPGVAGDIDAKPPVVDVRDLSNAPFWVNPVSSAEVARTRAGLREFIRQVRRLGRWWMFIDPYLSPGSRRYRDIGEIVAEVASECGGCEVEFHRWAMETDSVPGRQKGSAVTASEWEQRFRDAWQERFAATGVRAFVGLWPDLKDKHDRFLITRSVGLHCGNGFDVSSKSPMTVSCLDDAFRIRLWMSRDVKARKDEGVQSFEFGAGCSGG